MVFVAILLDSIFSLVSKVIAECANGLHLNLSKILQCSIYTHASSRLITLLDKGFEGSHEPHGGLITVLDQLALFYGL